MKRGFKHRCFVVTCMLSVLLVVACTTDDTEEPVDEGVQNESELNENELEGNEAADPVTVTVGVGVPEEGQAIVENWLAENHPHIRVEWLDDMTARSVPEWEELIVADRVPDIMQTVPSWGAHLLFEMEVDKDLSELIDQFNYDLSRFDDMTIEGIRFLSEDRGLIGLPKSRANGPPHFGGMIYNKDVFDLFGESYPTDGMTWDETIDMAGRLTGEEDGVHYYGFHFDIEFMLEYISVSQPALDPETDEPVISSDPKWQRGFDLLERIYSIPGMIDPQDPANHFENHAHYNAFARGNVAMSPFFNPAWVIPWEEDAGMNYDIVAAPMFEEDNLFPVSLGWIYFMTATAEHPQETFHVLQALLSDDYLIWEGSDFGAPIRLPIVDEEVINQVQLHPTLEDKNLEALDFHEMGPPIERSLFESDVRNQMWREWLPEFILSDSDPVTFARELEERIQALVAESQTAE